MDCSTGTTYCIDSGTIYQTDSTTCKAALAEGVYIFDASKDPVAFGDAADNGEYTIYICDADKKCARTYGYIKKDSSTFFKIIDSGAVDISSSLSDKTAEAECTPGTLFKDNSNAIKFCVSAGNGVAFGSDNNYIMANAGTDTGTTIFTTVGANSKSHLVINASTNAFVLNSVYKDNEYCSYANQSVLSRKTQFCSGSILNTLYECENGLCARSTDNVANGDYLVHLADGSDKFYTCTSNVCTPKTDNGVFAFKQPDASDETYEKLLSTGDITALTAITGVNLYSCTNGVCTTTDGYVKFNSGDLIAKCTDGVCEDYASVDCSQSSKVGEANLNDQTLSLCIEGQDSKTSADLGTNDIGFISDDKFYKITADIIGVYKEATDYIGTDNKLTSCTAAGACETDGAADGYYYVYSISDGRAKGLYSCTASSTCENVATPGHGYYLKKDSTTTALLCNNSGCQETESLTQSDCSGNKYELIEDSGLKYCNVEAEVALPSDTSVKYYTVNDVLASSINYPSEFLGSSTSKEIVIEVKKYSVLQYVNAEGICMESNTKKDCASGDNKYTCAAAGDPCTVEDVGACTSESTDLSCAGYYLVGSDLKSCSGGSCGSALELLGYFKSPDGTIIHCTTSNGSTYTCGEAEDETSTERCTKGKLDKNGKLCISGTTDDSITVFTADANSYVLPAATFYTGKNDLYYIITLDEDSVKIKTNSKKYEYATATASEKILIKKKGQCIAGNGITDIETDLIEYTKSKDLENGYTKENPV